jgi:hypothetical protein
LRCGETKRLETQLEPSFSFLFLFPLLTPIDGVL